MDEIRKLGEGDLTRFAEISGNAFPVLKLNTEEDVRRIVERQAAQMSENAAMSWYGTFRNGDMIAGMRFFDFVLYHEGVEVPAGGLGGVVVDLGYKKEKVALGMVRHFVKHYRELNYPLVVLYPFRPDFYYSMGFGHGNTIRMFGVKPGNFKACGPDPNVSKLNVRRLTAADAKKVSDCYARYAAKTHGMFKVSAQTHEKMVSSRELRMFGYFDQATAALEGYVAFTFHQVRSDNFLLNDIDVREFVCETSDAFGGIISFLRSQDDQIRQINFATQEEGFQYALSNPHDASDNHLPGGYQQMATEGLGMMYRVTDPALFLERVAAGGRNFGGVTLNLGLAITDPLDAGKTNYLLILEKGKLRSVRAMAADFTESPDCILSLSINEFSSLVMGCVRLSDLLRMGLAQLSETTQSDTVESIFQLKSKPMCWTYF